MTQRNKIIALSLLSTLLLLASSPARANYCDNQGSFFSDTGPYMGGTVVDTDTSVPVPGVKLILTCCDTGQDYDEVVTNAEGQYSFGGETTDLGFWIGGCYDVRIEDPCLEVIDRVNRTPPNCPNLGEEDCFQFMSCDDNDRYRVNFSVRNICGDEGCTLGYWKNHLCSWPDGYSPHADFDTTFGVDLFEPDVTLGMALRMHGGHEDRLARQGAAAILSAAHPEVDYPLSVEEVIALVQDGNADALEADNELGCPLGRCHHQLREHERLREHEHRHRHR